MLLVDKLREEIAASVVKTVFSPFLQELLHEKFAEIFESGSTMATVE